MDNGNDYGVGDFYHTDDEDDDAGSNDKKGYDADPEDMEELMKESSSALSDTPLTVRQLVIALQNNLFFLFVPKLICLKSSCLKQRIFLLVTKHEF